MQEGRIWWDLSRSRKPSLSQARENMRPRCNFFFWLAFFDLKKKDDQEKAEEAAEQTNVICDPSIFLGFTLNFNFDTEFYWDFIFTDQNFASQMAVPQPIQNSRLYILCEFVLRT